VGAASRRGRRPRTYEAVLAATADLLEGTPLSELSVAQILSAADVGRTSFYEHFSSKDDVVVKLMRRISAEVGEELEPLFAGGSGSPDVAVRHALRNVLATASRHARLLVTVAEQWPAVPELRAIWLAALGEATSRLAETIDRERAGRAAPPGADSRALAASLIWTAERSFQVAMTEVDDTLAGEESLIEPLVQLFVGTIYGRRVAGASDLRRSRNMKSASG
jgi:TetR/AcrR family transcriptional regulator, ethionamide resistance regulator